MKEKKIIEFNLTKENLAKFCVMLKASGMQQEMILDICDTMAKEMKKLIDNGIDPSTKTISWYEED